MKTSRPMTPSSGRQNEIGRGIQSVIAALPEKGNKRIEAIAALGNGNAGAPALMALALSEKGKCKTAAQKALAKLDYKPAGSLWKKLLDGKYMGEDVLMPSCSDCVSDEVAPVALGVLSPLFALPRGTKLSVEQVDKLRFCISLMLGKATPSMQEAYRLAAKNAEWIGSMKQMQSIKGEKASMWMINDTLRIWDATPEELQKIFPMLLTASIIKSMDGRLMALADELWETHGGPWLIPVFIKAMLNDSPESVHDAFSGRLDDGATAIYLYNALGLLFREDGGGKYQALVFWGDYSYGAYDTRCSLSRPVALDERWIWRLCENPNEMKPAVAFQSYNRGGVKYQDYDEMLLELLPRRMEAGALKDALASYFKARAKNDDGETLLYSDALSRLAQ